MDEEMIEELINLGFNVFTMDEGDEVPKQFTRDGVTITMNDELAEEVEKLHQEEVAQGVQCEEHGEHSIELDCPPGGIRPWDLIEGVVKGTGLKVDPTVHAAFFGHQRWAFPGISCEKWNKIQEKTKPRITALYHSGRIRYGSW